MILISSDSSPSQLTVSSKSRSPEKRAECEKGGKGKGGGKKVEKLMKRGIGKKYNQQVERNERVQRK